MNRRIGLSVAGGGFMGIGPAQFITHLEAWLDRPLASLLAWGAGTSTGAIVVSLLASGYSGSDILALFRQHLPGIFGTTPWRWAILKQGPRFDDSYIVGLLKEKLGTRTMADTLFPVYLTSWDVRKRDLKVFGPEDTDVPLWHAVRCSMAAPTYFSAQERRREDGGMAANDPTLIGLAGVIRSRRVNGTDDIRLLNLVTTGKTPEGPEVEPNRFVATTLTKEVLPALTSGNSSDVEFIGQAWAESLRALCGSMTLVRITPEMPDFDLAEFKHAEEVARIWSIAWDDRQDAVKLLLS